jgi:hypothetical protein
MRLLVKTHTVHSEHSVDNSKAIPASAVTRALLQFGSWLVIGLTRIRGLH